MQPSARASLVRSIVFVPIVSLALAHAAAAQSMFVRPGQLPPIDAATQAAIVDSITAAIDSIYVIEAGAKQIVAFLDGQLASGAYDDVTDPAEFVARLEKDAQATHRDNHFGIRVFLPIDPAAADQAEDPRDSAAFKRRRREHNFGFEKIEILPGNVGYLQLNEFAHAEEQAAAETAVASMNYLANAYAIIIDLRQNGGGSGSMIRLLATYLFAERQHLISWYERAIGETEQSRTLDYVPGRRSTEAPVFVLTSGRTASAAEEFTFDLQNLDRATIVGDTTAGAGNTVEAEYFSFEGFRVGIRLPYGRAFNPKNGQGWEGVGIVPDVAVPSEQALDVAYLRALDTLAETTSEPDVLAVIDWARTGLAGRIHPIELSAAQLADYAGTFGPRRVFLADGTLHYQREDGPVYRLQPMGEDLFRVGDLEWFRLRFGRDDAGQVVKVIGLYDDGNRDENAKSAP